MPLLVQAEREEWQAQIPRECWERLAHEALVRHGMSLATVDFTVYLVDRPTMREYHRRYRGESRDTDVMAFPAQTPDPETKRLYLGDVLVCYPVAQDQARQAGHGVGEELCLLMVHGLLHLLGYDDEDPAARSRMWQVQKDLLQQARVRLQTPP